jgi:hypothetical protein
MQALARITGLAALTAIVTLSYGLSSAWADPADTYATIEFSPGDTVPEGTLVTITGRAFCDEIHGGVCLAIGQELTVGKIQIQPALDGADAHVDCASLDHYGDEMGMGAPPFDMDFDTTGLGGETLGFRVHYVTPGGMDAPGTTSSDCADLTITLGDPLPDDTLSYTQGFYGASPIGEDLVDQLIDESTCEAIREILNASGFDDTAIAGGAIDCSVADDRDLVALFLTGTVGPGEDDGFLPAGNPSVNGPGLNLAAQKITLLLNLNLAALAEIPILSSYFINIDLVQDIVDGAPGPIVDPVFRNPDLYDFCVDTIPDGEDICDPGTLVLSALGDLAQALDDAGTTVEDVCDAAVAMIIDDLESVSVNGVDLTRDDMADILGLINESYDEGTPTGFITLGDVD